MKIKFFAKTFAREEDGAVTTDWVVLTAALAALGIAVAVSVGTSTSELADKISDHIDETDLLTY